MVSPSNFLSGYRCPLCNESKMERRIRAFLEKCGFRFETQYMFDELIGRSGGNLKFDFAILKNDSLEFLIEYDGEFHYLPIWSEWHLERQQFHDKLKDDYCSKNNIPLLRISYQEKENFGNIIFDFNKKLLKEGIV
jgi:hypothetical protein